jgi:hypothetical protein
LSSFSHPLASSYLLKVLDWSLGLYIYIVFLSDLRKPSPCNALVCSL